MVNNILRLFDVPAKYYCKSGQVCYMQKFKRTNGRTSLLALFWEVLLTVYIDWFELFMDETTWFEQAVYFTADYSQRIQYWENMQWPLNLWMLTSLWTDTSWFQQTEEKTARSKEWPWKALEGRVSWVIRRKVRATLYSILSVILYRNVTWGWFACNVLVDDIDTVWMGHPRVLSKNQ